MKQPYGIALPPAPTQGDICFLETGPTTGETHFCFADGVWTLISGGASSGASRLEYGAACILLAEQNWNMVAFPNVMHRFGADLMDNPAQYFSRCQWSLKEVTAWGITVNTWKDLDFANAADIYTFIRANFAPGMAPNTAANCAILTWYDTIDDTLPHINKIWGINVFYSMLKGASAYRTMFPCLGATIQWSTFPAWFESLCNANVGFGPGHVYVPGDEASVWLARNEKKMYGLPRDGFSSMIGSAGGRRVWDWGTSSFIPLPAIRAYRNVPSSGDPLAFCALNVNTHTSWSWVTGSGSNLIKEIMMDYASTVAVYALEDAFDPNNRAVLLKPYGVDRLGLNWYDTNTYDLYGLYTRKNTSPLPRFINPLSGQISASNDFVWLDRPKWEPPSSNTKARLTKNMVGLQPYTTQFFLKDKVTRKISRVSTARVVRAMRHKNAPFKYEVRR